MNQSNTTRCLGVFQLSMIAIVSVDSLRNLPMAAQYGMTLVSFYLFAAITFFIPLVWITSQLATRYPHIGGSYLWVEAAFGKFFGTLSIWLQWTYNLIWYPTIFAFISSTLASLLFPHLSNNTVYILTSCLLFYWLLTFVHTYGIRASSIISTVSALIGTLLPMGLMILLSLSWIFSGKPSATPLGWEFLKPTGETLKNLAYFSNILFSLLGLEVIAMHAGNVKSPEKTYPRALSMSAFLILTTLVLSSLALCVVIPAEQIGLVSGVMDVIKLFFKQHFPLGAFLLGWCIILGGFGIAASWMIGLARGIHVAITHSGKKNILTKLNRNEVPINVLILQGIIYTFLLSAFVLLPNVNNAYWLLSALTSQFALLYYILLFSAAFKLLFSQKSFWRKVLNRILPISAILISLVGIGVGFLPPNQIGKNEVFTYECFMVLSLIVFCLLPFFLIRIKSKD